MNNREIELKLAIPADAIRALLRHPSLRNVTRRKLRAQAIHNVYYDTPELALHKRRIALRLRRLNGRWLQTIKAGGAATAGLHERMEWETPAVADTFNFDGVDDPAVAAILSEVSPQLAPIFTTAFRRTRRLLVFPSGEEAEFALDQGSIELGEEQVPLCEIEIELRGVNAGPLFELALALQESLPLIVEDRSKAERGYRLFQKHELVLVKASPPVFVDESNASEAFVSILQTGLTHLRANEEGTLQSDEPEYVHQMRVALRRMRSALSLFAPLVENDPCMPAVRDELRWLTGELNDARNWDVFAHDTLPPIREAFGPHAGFAWLDEQAQAEAGRQRERARAAVASARYQKLLLTLGAWLITKPWEDGVDAYPESGVKKVAATILDKRDRKLKKSAKHLHTLTDTERHEVRIAAKKTRYAAEFFSALYPHKRREKYIDALADLQEVLGQMNDAATTVSLMHAVDEREPDGAGVEAIGIVIGWVTAASRARLDELQAVWTRYAKRKSFW